MNQPMTAQDVRTWVHELRNGDDRTITIVQVHELYRALLKSIADNQLNPSPTRALAEIALELI